MQVTHFSQVFEKIRNEKYVNLKSDIWIVKTLK